MIIMISVYTSYIYIYICIYYNILQHTNSNSFWMFMDLPKLGYHPGLVDFLMLKMAPSEGFFWAKLNSHDWAVEGS